MRYLRLTLAMLIPALGLLLAFGASSAAAQGGTATLRGRVIEADGTPVVGATITALSGSVENTQEYARTTTGANGVWEMTVPAGITVWPHFNTFDIWWGYSYNPPFNLTAGQVVDGVDFVLAPRAVATQAPPPPATPVPMPTSTPMPPAGMPRTGSDGGQDGLFLPLLAVALVSLGVGAVMRLRQSRRIVF